MKSRHVVVGILAHVDAGKTTLSESLLYLSGSIRKLGRVDHGDAFLDSARMERERGITIFSKQARFPLGEREAILLDTPGHVDFSAEMERTLSVMDCAVLVVSGADGVQSHTLTLWKLLEAYHIPVFLFINKMDQAGTDMARTMDELGKRLSEHCVNFSAAGNAQKASEKTEDPDWGETLAMCSEALMEEYLQNGVICGESIREAVRQRQVFPCFFGSALKLTGVADFLDGLDRYIGTAEYPEEFGARVYKIARDEQGNRLTYMKLTGGRLAVRDLISAAADGGKTDRGEAVAGGQEKADWQEKISQIRLYSGERFEAVPAVSAGNICAVLGLSRTTSGQGLGFEAAGVNPVLAPVLTYQVLFPAGCDTRVMLADLRLLEEEEPQLHVVWNEEASEISVQVMGEMELAVLQSLIAERFGVHAEFGTGTIVYQETIQSAVEGVGHFEPLRHYAEVHVVLSPGERGSGLQFASACSEDMLARNWQRLILTHLAEKRHRGVLTGAEITDMKITLVAGRAHVKHTEGGDFRQATYRAVRQGLKKAESVLLEPVYEFALEVPGETVGRALSDIQRRGGEFEPPQTKGEMTLIRGTAPVASMRDYPGEVTAYTKGLGRIFLTPAGYRPCADQDKIVAEIGYDPESDIENPTGSVFCSHGGSVIVPWDQVEEHMQVDSGWRPNNGSGSFGGLDSLGRAFGSDRFGCGRSADGTETEAADSGYADEAELAAIFERTYGSVRREKPRYKRKIQAETAGSADALRRRKQKLSPDGTDRERYLLVDGYNIIFAWRELSELAAVNLDSARDQLMERLSNYQGYTGDTVILVFDAYKVRGGQGSVQKYNNVYIVYTKEAETADRYIERTVNRMGREKDIRVATSDGLVQMIIWGEGARRLSAHMLREEVEAAEDAIRALYAKYNTDEKHYPFRDLVRLMQAEAGENEDQTE